MNNSTAAHRRERGIALVLVMTVVLALAIIATPFVLSMLLQERSGTLSRYESQADYGTEGAKNYALWRLMMSLDPVERRAGAGPFASYYWDNAQEFDVRVNDMFLTRNAKVLDPKGAIWGISVQDEQGKLNVKTAPPQAIQRIQQMVDSRVVSHKDYLTLYSGRDASWICPQRIRGMGNVLPAQQNVIGASGLYVDRPEVLGQNARVRATKPGLKPFEATVTANYILGQTQNGIETNPAIPGQYADGVLDVEQRHPVNINTARRETLIAIFEGLRLYNVPQSQVGRQEAVRLANAFHGRDFQRLEQFLLALAGTGLNPQQLIAVSLNAVCPTAARLDGTGTVGFCFKSYDVHTVEALASMNNPAGAEVAGRGFREVVSVSPPSVLTLSAESQLDFDLMLMPIAVAFRDAKFAGGYPFGGRVVTFPNMIPLNFPVTSSSGAPTGPSDVVLKPQQKPGPTGNEAYVQPVAARDTRGQSNLERQLQGWQNQDPRDHFDDAQEGKRLQNSAHTYPWGQVFTFNYDAQNPPPADQQTADVACGGIEAWIRFDAIANPLTIFDLREQDYTNRVTLRVENGELIFTVCDSTIGTPQDTIDNGAAEVRQPFTPVAATWYHFGAYWKGTRFAHLAMLVDGSAHPQQKFNHVNPEGNKVMTRLSSALTPTATSISLQDDSWVPGYMTPLLIGDEIVLYDKAAGTLLRGARGTTAVQHPSGAAVSIWGYSSKVRAGQVTTDFGQVQIQIPYDRIPRGGATLQYNFGLQPQAQVAGDKQDPMTMMWFVDAAQNQIGVITANIMDFPDQGYLTIGQEVVFYTGRSTGGLGGIPPGTAKFTGCVRGQHGTTAAIHNSNAQVRLWSIAVTNFTNYPSPTIVQVGDEWFGPVWKDPTKPNFWISTVNAGAPLPLRRGNPVFASIPGAHSAGDRVIPTFLAREADPQQPGNRLNLGRNDWVTVVDAQNNKEQQRVRNAGPPPPPPQGQPPIWGGNYNIQGGGQIAAFENDVTRDYVADQLFTRVLKFPSGELLGLQWLSQASPNFSIGALSGTLDEVKCFADRKRHLLGMQQLGTTDTSMAINQGGGMGQRGGLLKIGDEYVGYATAQGTSVGGLKRGWLNSTAEVHAQGDAIFSMPWIPVSSLLGDMTATDANIPLAQALSGIPRRNTKGCLLVDSEVMFFEWNGGNGLNLGMPVRWDGTTGLYRGMFGTQPATHSANTSLVYGMPYRYTDTYKAQEFDSTMSYFQWSTKMELANWRTMSWVQEVPLQDPNLVVHCLVRVDGKGEFFDRPAMNDNVQLLEFLTAGNAKINRTGYQNEAGQLDVRFYVEYKSGSFDAVQPWNTMSWKRALKIKELRVEYDRPLQTLYHEDR